MNPYVFAEVNWLIEKPPDSETQTSNKISEWKLSDDWIILCVWSDNSSPLPQSLKFCRKSAKEDVVIKGKLLLSRNGDTISAVKVLQVVESGVTSMKKKLNYPILRATRSGPTKTLILKGHVDISALNQMFWKLPPRETRHLACLHHLSQDLAKLIHPDPPIAADVILKCGDATFPAHKTILCARSPVFAAMFSTPMKESTENKVDITDISESTLEAILSFIYTGVVAGLRDYEMPWYRQKMTILSVLDLAVAADKYQIRGLKNVCRVFLKDNISPENVLLFLDVGNAVDGELKDFAMDYLYQCRDFSGILESEAWKDLKLSNLEFAIEILSSVVKWKDEQRKKHMEQLKNKATLEQKQTINEVRVVIN